MKPNQDRFLMALYYAYGRNDADIQAGRDWPFEPIAFAEFHDAQWKALERGDASYCPSVQDSYEIYRRSLK